MLHIVKFGLSLNANITTGDDKTINPATNLSNKYKKDHRLPQYERGTFGQLLFRRICYYDSTKSTRKAIVKLRTVLYFRLNKYETAPNFIPLNQNLTSDCLLI